MGIKLTKEQFIKRAIDKHGNKYRYDKLIYFGMGKKVEIFCNKCGIYFWQRAGDHLSGSGCKICGGVLVYDTASFILNALKIHGIKYNYDNVTYIGTDEKIKIYCNACNKYFSQTPNAHINGKQGCPRCANINTGIKQTMTLEEFIERAKKTHGDKYSYSECEYIDAHEKVKIYCNTCKRFFQQRAYCHLQGEGCNICGRKKAAKSNTLEKEKFIAKAKKKHGNKYNYDKVVYIANHSKIEIFCNTCKKVFWQEPAAHAGKSGEGCPYCIGKYKTTEEFIIESKEINGEDTFSYEKVNYIDQKTPVELFCNKCKQYFSQSPKSHLKGNGCSKCNESHGEKYIRKLLKDGNYNFKSQQGFPKCRHKRMLRFDFTIYNDTSVIGVIEYQGAQHYKPIPFFGGEPTLQENKLRDSIKEKYCNNNNIPLCIIPYTERNLSKILFDFLKQIQKD
jgi:glutaredoxin